jgi:hypothetical protein
VTHSGTAAVQLNCQTGNRQPECKNRM